MITGAQKDSPTPLPWFQNARPSLPIALAVAYQRERLKDAAVVMGRAVLEAYGVGERRFTWDTPCVASDHLRERGRSTWTWTCEEAGLVRGAGGWGECVWEE